MFINSGNSFYITYSGTHYDALHIGILCHTYIEDVLSLIIVNGDANNRAVVLVFVVHVTVAVFRLEEQAVAVDERQRAVEQVCLGDRLL